jgi:prepilin-type N-terminal cleavage/methylation domain-containing protein
MHGQMSRYDREDGFALIELLVVCLIVGLLAMIAIPAFLKRRSNANDAGAKGMLNTSAQSAVAYGLTNGYATMTPAKLKAIEPSINTNPNGQAVLVNATPTVTGYILTVVSASADTFNLTNSSGQMTKTCLVAASNGNTATNTGGGCNSGTW